MNFKSLLPTQLSQTGKLKVSSTFRSCIGCALCRCMSVLTPHSEWPNSKQSGSQQHVQNPYYCFRDRAREGGREREPCTYRGLSEWTCRYGSWCLCSQRQTWSHRKRDSCWKERTAQARDHAQDAGGTAQVQGARLRAPGGKLLVWCGWLQVPGGRPRGPPGRSAHGVARLQTPGWIPRGGGSPCWRSAPGSGRSGGCSDGGGSRSPPLRGSRTEATRIERGAGSAWPLFSQPEWKVSWIKEEKPVDAEAKEGLQGPWKEREVEMRRSRVDAMLTQDCPVICLQYIKT